MKCEIQLLLQLVSAMERKWFTIDVYHQQSSLENDLCIEVVFAISFCTGKKIISIHGYHKQSCLD